MNNRCRYVDVNLAQRKTLCAVRRAKYCANFSQGVKCTTRFAAEFKFKLICIIRYHWRVSADLILMSFKQSIKVHSIGCSTALNSVDKARDRDVNHFQFHLRWVSFFREDSLMRNTSKFQNEIESASFVDISSVVSKNFIFLARRLLAENATTTSCLKF